MKLKHHSRFPRLRIPPEQLLALLPEKQRRIVLADAESRDGLVASHDLAQELGIPQSTVRVYRRRALERLRREIELLEVCGACPPAGTTGPVRFRCEQSQEFHQPDQSDPTHYRVPLTRAITFRNGAMTDHTNRDPSADDLFRNRIALALRELDQSESDADIAAALDAVPAEPLSDAAFERIMRRVRGSMAAAVTGSIAGRDSHARPKTNAEQHTSRVLVRRGLAPQPIRPMKQLGIVTACAAALLAIGLVFQRADVGDPTPLVGRDRSTSVLLPGELISSSDQASHRAVGTDRERSNSRADSQAGSAAPNTPLTSSSRVKLGDTLTTGPRQKRRVTLPDGSVLSINEQSQVTVISDRRVKLLAGEVFVEVVPANNAERFVVETPQRTVTALGTKFVVKAHDRATNVVVTQGKVRVSGVEDAITAGQELIADLTESRSAERRPAKRSAYVVEWVKDLMAAAGSIVVPTSEHAGGTVTVVDPQGQEMKRSLRKLHVDVHIEDGFARTTIDQTYFNHTWQQLEGTFRFPLPADASLSRLAMYVNGKLMEGGMVERDYGRNVFEQIRYTKRDPALLEWVDGSTFQMRVFPLEARQEKRILLSDTQRLPNDHGRSVYRFPAGHSLDGVREWSAQLRAKGAAGTKWYSPSHLLNGRDEQDDLLLDGRDEYAALDRDLVVELSDEPEGASPRFRTTNRGLAPNGTDFRTDRVAERRKPPGFVEFARASTGRLAPYRY